MYKPLSSGNVVEAPIDLISPHPNNPAPLSAKYSEILGYPIRVEDAQVEILIGNLRANGYDPNEPLLLRPVGDRLQAIKGNHRFVAMWMLTKIFREIDQEYIPAIIEEMTDQKAWIKLFTLNGRKVDGWMAARLAFHTCTEGGMTVAQYAKEIGHLYDDGRPNHTRVSRWVQACRFVDYIAQHSLIPDLQSADAITDPKDGLFKSVDRVAEFMYFDQEDWLWISEFYLRYHLQIPATRRQKIAKAIKETKELLNRVGSYPDRWSDWLRWEYIRGEIASECAASDESHLATYILPQLISEANKTYESDDLPFIYEYLEVVGTKVEQKRANLKEEFRSELIKQIESRGGKYYRLIDVAEASRGVLDRYRFIAEKHENFRKIENTAHIEQKIVGVAPPAKTTASEQRSPIGKALPLPKVDAEKRLWVEQQYQPKGMVETLEGYTFHSDRQYSFLFSRIGGGSMEEFFQNADYIYRMLTEDGVFVVMLPHKYSPSVIEELEYKVANSSRLHLRGIDGAVYADEKPRLAIASSTRTLIHEDYEELLIFTPTEDLPLKIRTPLPKMALEPVHDIVRAFADPNDTILDPFAFSGEVVVAAKSLGYRCDYLVSDQEQLDLIQRWCDRTEFPNSLF